MKKHLTVLAAVIAALSLAGCSASGISPTVEGGLPTNGAGTSASTGGEGTFKGSDIGGKKDSFIDKIGGIFEDKAMYDEMEAADGGYFAAGEAAAPKEPSGDYAGVDILPGDFIIDDRPEIQPQSGLLTGGEWNDNAHWADWNALYGSREDWKGYKSDWRTTDDYRLTVTVTSAGKPLEGAKVSWGDSASAITNNKGEAYLFSDGMPTEVTVTCGDKSSTALVDWVLDEHDLHYSVDLDGAVSPIAQKLDLMIMCDTTGSMGDELEYLKVELEDIVKSIKSQNANIPTRVSVNFYRDTEDEYEVRQFPFSDNIDEVAEAIRAQSANGGGDFPEAVHTALDSAVNKHDWSSDSVKIMFLVLDAPPHEDAQIVDSVNKYVAKAAEMGIRIIPVASSGIDKSTEYLLRTMAFTTGGTYTFLTDDSGVGGGHIEPTVGAYNVEKLNDMMVRIVNNYLGN